MEKTMQIEDSKVIEFLVWAIGGLGALITGVAIRIATNNYKDFTKMRRRMPRLVFRDEYERFVAEQEAIKAWLETGIKHIVKEPDGGVGWLIVQIDELTENENENL